MQYCSLNFQLFKKYCFVSAQYFATNLGVTSDGLSLCALLNNRDIHMYSIFGSLLWESSSWNFKTVTSAAINPRGDQLCCSVMAKEDSEHNSITLVQSLLRNSPSICSSSVTLDITPCACNLGCLAKIFWFKISCLICISRQNHGFC